MNKIKITALAFFATTVASAQTPSSNETKITVPLTPLQKAVGAEPAASVVADLPAPGVPRKLKFGLVTATFGNMFAMNTGAAQPVSTINQLRADYKVSDLDSVRINQIASNEWGQNSQTKNSFVMGDLYLQYARSKITHAFGDGILKANTRLYLPLSTATIDKSQLASLRTDFELDKTFSRFFDIAIHVVPWISYQRDSSYAALANDGSSIRKANSAFNLAYYVTSNFNFTKDLCLTHEMGFMRYWFRSDSSQAIAAIQKEFLYLDTSLNYTINDTFGVGLGLSSYLARDLLNQSNQFSFYRSDETDYYLTASANF